MRLQATVAELNQTPARYVLVSGMADLSFPEICAYLEHGGDFELVESAAYTSKLARGPQVWRLYRRVAEQPPPANGTRIQAGWLRWTYSDMRRCPGACTAGPAELSL
jgi:hypothetical protein